MSKIANPNETPQKSSEGNIITSEEFLADGEKPEKKTKGFRNYVFTSFHESEPLFLPSMNYLAYGKETCPTTGKHHWQGFVCLKSQKTMKAMITYLTTKVNHGLHTWTQPMMGSLDENEEYCSKEKSYTTHGRKPSQGQRSDLEALSKELIAGKSVDEICMDDPLSFHQYGRTLERIETIQLRKRKRTEMTQGLWLHGKTGVGKSHKAFDLAENASTYVWTDDNGWWDGYNGQDVVIINDFRGEIRFGELLQIADKWPFSVRRRGKEPFPFTSKTVIVTSSMKPEEVYKNMENDSIDQLRRRFKIREICKFN